MKTIAFACALLLACAMTTVPATASAADKPAAATRLLHVVSFKFKKEATQEQMDHVVEAFRALKTKVPGIQAFQWGTNVSPEKHDKGFTHGFILTFRDEKDRDGYLVHPEHKAFGKLLGPILDDVFVLDYWARN